MALSLTELDAFTLKYIMPRTIDLIFWNSPVFTLKGEVQKIKAREQQQQGGPQGSAQPGGPAAGANTPNPAEGMAPPQHADQATGD